MKGTYLNDIQVPVADKVAQFLPVCLGNVVVLSHLIGCVSSSGVRELGPSAPELGS